jgi:hypothetical protein
VRRTAGDGKVQGGEALLVLRVDFAGREARQAVLHRREPICARSPHERRVAALVALAGAQRLCREQRLEARKVARRGGAMQRPRGLVRRHLVGPFRVRVEQKSSECVY